jgi:hypothetical protein
VTAFIIDVDDRSREVRRGFLEEGLGDGIGADTIDRRLLPSASRNEANNRKTKCGE